MTDEKLAHMCHLSIFAAGGIRAGKDDWIEYVRSADSADLSNHHTCLSILADTFVELMKRQGISPRVRIKANSEAA
jgi:hypothetical protein